MADLVPYLISEFKSGINDYMQPWMRPQDAFEPLENAYTYRGTINKRSGYAQFGDRLADQNPVMGITQYINESTGDIRLVVCTTRNAYLYDSGTNAFNAIPIVENIGTIDASAVATTALPTQWTNVTFGSVSVTDGVTTITANGAGNFTAGGIFAAGSTINYTTGVVSINTNGTGASNTTLTMTASFTNYFSGNLKNFFHWINWQATDPNTLTQSTSYLYLTNNKDAITRFDGTNLSRPFLYVNEAHTQWITKAIDVNVFENRLLVFRPTIQTQANASNQAIYYSAQYDPTNFIADVPGNGGFEVAATGDIFQAEELLRNAVVCFFSNSTWLFRFTGIPSKPFQFDRISVNKRHGAPYGTMGYDERATSIGTTGLLACDGVNVQRYDASIINYYETNMSEEYMAQCFTQRFDNLNQTWTLYVRNGNQTLIGGTGGDVAPASDKALIYNHIENSWATYTWSKPMTCLGLYFQQTSTTWASLTQTWDITDTQWDGFSQQKTSPIMLSGDAEGYVYRQGNPANVTDNGTGFSASMTGIRWNPIMNTGEKIQVPYIDIYYQAVSTDALSVQMQLNFYVDNCENTATVKLLTLDGRASNKYYWKRIYCNLIGEFVQMEMVGGANSGWQILGFILWASPAGRFTP